MPGFTALSFLDPRAFWLLLTVPAILALWALRPRRRRVRVSSLLLWPGSPAQRQSARPWQRPPRSLLLWLQLVAAALLAVAAARPYLPAGPAGRQVVVLLDASGSMRARDVAPDRFGAAKAAVIELARALGPGQELTLIRMDGQPRTLVAAARGAAEVERALAGEAPSYGPADVPSALALAAGATSGPAEWVLVGDGTAALPPAARRPPGTAFRTVAVGSSGANVAVTGLTGRVEGGTLTLQAGLRNTGPAPVAGRLQLLAEDRLMAVREWRLEGGATGHVSWTGLPPPSSGAASPPGAPGAAAPGPRWYEARLSGVGEADNVLEHDDRAWAAPGGAPDRALLLVTSGEPFLERALLVQGEVRAVKAGAADWPALAQGQPYPLTVLDRVAPDPAPRGSALLIASPEGEAFSPSGVWLREDHPVLRHVEWSDVQVTTARRGTLGPEWETVIGSDGGPLLAVRTTAGGRQAHLTFALAESDLPLRPAFPILMANLLEWLVPRPDDGPRNVAPGAALAVEAGPLTEEVWVEALPADPTAQAGQAGRVALAPPWPPLPFRPPAPGVYRLVQASGGGRGESLVVADGYHPDEAAPAPGASALQQGYDGTRSLPQPGPGRGGVLGVGVDFSATAGQAAPLAGGAAPYWPWLAAALLALSTLEWWVDARGR